MKKSIEAVLVAVLLVLAQASVWACGVEAPGAGSPAEQEETAVEETI